MDIETKILHFRGFMDFLKLRLQVRDPKTEKLQNFQYLRIHRWNEMPLVVTISSL